MSETTDAAPARPRQDGPAEAHQEAANGRPPRRGKSPGRVAAAKRVNALLRLRREQGAVWPGGHPPTHGQRMLEGLIRRGDGLPGTLGQLLAEKEQGYLADLGGAAEVSNMEAGLIRRLAEGDLFLALVRAQMLGPHGEPKRLPWARLRDVATLHARLADSYKGLALALGLKRREVAAPRQVIIQRWDTEPPGDPHGAAAIHAQAEPAPVPPGGTAEGPP